MREIGDIRRDIQKSYRKLHNWRKVGARFGVSPGMAWRIAVEGYEPQDALIRLRLDLPAKKLAPVCKHCGEVHIKLRCERKRKKAVRLVDMSVDQLIYALEHRQELNRT